MKSIPVMLLAALVLWGLGLIISAIPKPTAIVFWMGAAFCLGRALYLHIRDQG
jgi:hypothetical protein